ncbi:MAG: ABC transporter permease, partial [bacterium]|nr:ABC transporter permease [bacterium]
MGKILKIDDEDYKITGLMYDVPKNSHFTFNFLISFETLYVLWGGRERVERWNSNNTWGMYIYVQENTNIEELENKLTELRLKNLPDDTHGHSINSTFRLQLLTDIHLHSRVNFDEANISDIRYIYLFSAIAFLIMLIACLNYMNLSTARSIKRAKEVGIRKVVGAFRINLIKQFFGESVLFVLIALVLSICFVYLILPFFGSFIERELEFNMLNNIWMYLGISGSLIFVGIISGSYPALFLSSFKPVNIIRGIIRSGSKKSLGFRNTLVIIQFMISVMLIVCSLVVYSQLEYIRNKNLGFNKEHIIYGIASGVIRNNFQPFKEEIEKYPSITDIYALGSLPTSIGSNSFPEWEGKQEGEEFLCYQAPIDYNFVDFFECEIIEGRDYSREFSTDLEEGWLLNETAVKMIGWDEPIGKRFGFSWINPEGRVIGVVKDFHNTSLHIKVEPVALYLKKPNRSSYYYAVKVRSENI